MLRREFRLRFEVGLGDLHDVRARGWGATHGPSGALLPLVRRDGI
ncbi:hypothetical protein ACU610_16315 [Geodermatophilus sp. URMC 61]